MGIQIINPPGATVTGVLTPGNVPILTAAGIEDSGVALVSTIAATTVWSNNTSGEAAPGANSVLTLGNGTAAAPIYSFNASTGTGVYSPAANYVALTAGGNRGFQVRSTDATSYLEYIYSGGVVLRAQGGTNVDASLSGNGTGNVYLKNNGASGNSILFRATGPVTAGGASNYLRLTVGDGAGNGPSLTPVVQGTGDTNVNIDLIPLGTGVLRTTTHVLSMYATAVGAGAATQAWVKASTTANLGIYYGTGAPGFSAAKGSIYSQTDATTTTTRLYVNTNGSTTWASLTTSA